MKNLIMLLLLLLLPAVAQADSTILINEIAWMGTSVSANDEWIELFNNSDAEIDLTGWTLVSADDEPKIVLDGKIPAHGYFLLERTDDNSVPNISADQIHTGALNNSGEELALRDNQNSLVDSVSGWLAGDNTTKQTMERKDDGSWQTSQNQLGTPKAQNSSGQVTEPDESQDENPNQESQATSTQEITSSSKTAKPVNTPPMSEAGPDITALSGQEIAFDGDDALDRDGDSLTYFWNFGDGSTSEEKKAVHVYNYPGQYIVSLTVSDGKFSDMDTATVNIYSQSIIISEFIPNPAGSDTTNEWIEIYNNSDQISNLSNWQLDDEEGGSSPFVFPNGTLIAPRQFLILTRPVTGLSLNNDEDSVRLLFPDGTLASQINYSGKLKEGQSIAFDGNEYLWTTSPTPSTANIISSRMVNSQDSQNLLPVAIQQSQEAMDQLNVDLSQAQKFSAIGLEDEIVSQLPQEENYQTDQNQTANKDQPTNNPPSENQKMMDQTAGLGTKTSKNNLILVVSIVLSFSLLLGWSVNIIRKKLEPQ